MRKRGTRIDVLDVEGKPGFFRIMRFGNFSTHEGSTEMEINKLDLQDLVEKGQAVLDKLNEASK